MRAIAINSFGGYDKVELLDLPIPQPKPGEVLIKVRIAGVGNWDSLVRQNVAGLGQSAGPFPIKLGWECVGVIAEVGEEVDIFKKGQTVIAYPHQRGTWAEYVATPAATVAFKPISLSFEQAAGLPVPGVTAHQTIFEELKLKPGKIVLITGGAGTTASLAIQFAAKLKTQIITTARPQHNTLLKELGASMVIDYTATDFEQAILDLYPGGIDAVMETVAGNNNIFKSIQTLRPGGRVASIVSWDKNCLHRQDVTIQHVVGQADGARLDLIAQMIDNGHLKIAVPQVLPLAQAAEAQRMVETGQGQVVLQVADNS